jgi:hypothetical protein
MANQSLVLSVSETMAMLMRSMGTYAYYRLPNQECKEAFRLAMKDCIVQVTSGIENLEMIKLKIEGIRPEADHLYPSKMFSKKLEHKRGHNIAVDMALDIVNSIEARFVTGQYDSEPRAYKNHGWTYINGEGLFGEN